MGKVDLNTPWAYVAPYGAIMDKQGNTVAHITSDTSAYVGPLLAKLPEVWRVLKEMAFAYTNKDSDFPHQFEVNALKDFQSLVTEIEGDNHVAK